MTNLPQIVFYLLNTSNDVLLKKNPTSYTLSKKVLLNSVLVLKMLQFVMSDEVILKYQMILYSLDLNHELQVEETKQDTQIYVDLHKVSLLRTCNLSTQEGLAMFSSRERRYNKNWKGKGKLDVSW